MLRIISFFILRLLANNISVCLNERKHRHFFGYSVTFFLTLCIRLVVTMGTSKHNRKITKPDIKICAWWKQPGHSSHAILLQRKLLWELLGVFVGQVLFSSSNFWECINAKNLLNCKENQAPTAQPGSITKLPGYKKPGINLNCSLNSNLNWHGMELASKYYYSQTCKKIKFKK